MMLCGGGQVQLNGWVFSGSSGLISGTCCNLPTYVLYFHVLPATSAFSLLVVAHSYAYSAACGYRTSGGGVAGG